MILTKEAARTDWADEAHAAYSNLVQALGRLHDNMDKPWATGAYLTLLYDLRKLVEDSEPEARMLAEYQASLTATREAFIAACQAVCPECMEDNPSRAATKKDPNWETWTYLHDDLAGKPKPCDAWRIRALMSE